MLGMILKRIYSSYENNALKFMVMIENIRNVRAQQKIQ